MNFMDVRNLKPQKPNSVLLFNTDNDSKQSLTAVVRIDLRPDPKVGTIYTGHDQYRDSSRVTLLGHSDYILTKLPRPADLKCIKRKPLNQYH